MMNGEEAKLTIENKKKNEKEKIRYCIFDNFKGLLIFLVVFGHFLWDYSNKYDKKSLSRKIVLFIFSFHMPSFVFVSGILTSDNSVKISNAFKLLILYYVFNDTFSLFVFFFLKMPYTFLNPNYSYWYILALFWWRITIKYLSKIKFIFIISINISLLEGYWICFDNTLSIGRTIGFFPFFLAGYKIHNTKKFKDFLKWRNGSIIFFLSFFLFIIFILIISFFISKNEISNDALLMKSYSQINNNSLRERILIMIISSLMIFFNMLLLPEKNIPLISKFGRNSLYIYLFHRIFTLIIRVKYLNKIFPSMVIITISFILSLIISLIFGSDSLSRICNGFLAYIHKHLLECSSKGQIFGFIFSLLFILLLLIIPINDYINQKNI